MNQKFSKKVFHGLVNYGTQAGYIAKGLRAKGVTAKSYVAPDRFQREADFHFKHGGSLLNRLLIHLIYNPAIKIWCLFKYDIFHFYYGTSLLPYHVDLPLIKMMGKKIVHHYLGHDVELYRETKDRYEFSNMDFFANAETGAEHDRKVKKRYSFESKYSDFQIVCAPQYSPFVPNSTFIPLAINLMQYQYNPLARRNYYQDPVRIVHAPTNRGVKGTKFLEEAVNKLQNEGLKVELKICEGITHDQLMEEYKNADFSVVSLLGGWYGTAGIEAMAIGRGIVAFLRDEYFAYVDETFKTNNPIVNASKNNIYTVLKNVLTEKDFQNWGKKSRKFVEEHHNIDAVSSSVLNIYKSLD